MLDHPVQFALSVGVMVIIVGYMWRSRGSVRGGPHGGWRRAGRLLARLMLVLILLVALLLAADGTRYMTANICLDFDAGTEWCLHGTDTDVTGDTE